MYNLFGCIILICLVLNLGFASCFVSGQKKFKNARRNARSAIIKLDQGDDRFASTADYGVSVKSVQAASNFLKKSLFEFINGVVQTGVKRALPSRSTKVRHFRNNGYRKHKTKIGKRRQRILKLRNDTDVSGGHRERKCKFPFIFDGKTVYACLFFAGDRNRKWCSTTSNYDRDMRWTWCMEDGTPVKRSKHTPYTIKLTLERSEDPVANIGVKKSIGDHADIPEDVRGRIRSGEMVADEVCDTCDQLPRNNSEAAVSRMQEEIDDVDKNDERIHSLVSKEVDNFIGSVLAKHGVPDTEQKELLALNAKLSTELAQEVSCKMNINQEIGSPSYDCKQWNSTDALNSTTQEQEQKSNITSVPASRNSTNDDLLKNEVDNFISTILSQHGVSSGKQKDIVKFIRRASTDIADQIGYVVSYAKAGGILKNDSDSAKKYLGLGTVSNISVSNTTNNNSIHTAVDSFLGLVLEKNGVPDEQQKDILAWNAQLSTDISDTVNNIVEDAKKLHEKARAHRKLQALHNKDTNKDTNLKSQLKPNITLSMEFKNESGNKLLPSHSGDVWSKEASQLQASMKAASKENSHSSADKVDTTAPTATNTDKDPLLESLYKKAHGKDEQKDWGVEQNPFEQSDKKDPNDDYKNYDDVSTENDIEIGLDDMNMNDNGDKTDTDLDSKGTAPDVVDTIVEKEKQMDEKEAANATAQHQMEFDKDAKLHAKNVVKPHHRILTGDDAWDKYLSDNMWETKNDDHEEKPKSGQLAHHSPKEGAEGTNSEREQLDEDEKNMINYVSDSIIQSVKNVEGSKEIANKDEIKDNDISFKKIDSGKKPYTIFRVKPGGKGETNNDESGMDSIDVKTQKVIPGAKNINIIIINNQNSSALDLNEIENTIARSGDISPNANNLDDNGRRNITFKIVNNSTNSSSVDKNLFLLLNTTATRQKLGSNMTMAGPTENKNVNTSAVGRTHTNKSLQSATLLANSSSRLNDSRDFIQSSNNLNFSRLLGEYDTSTLRKNGHFNMIYAPEEVVIHTFGGNANGAKCKFPYIFDGDTYFECINSYREKPWCSATANYDKLPIWGFCEQQNKKTPLQSQPPAVNTQAQETRQEELADIVHNEGEEVISKHSGMKTYGGNANGARCVIPFVYDGQTHMRCIPRADGTAWCAASHSYDIHPVWGNCCEKDVYTC